MSSIQHKKCTKKCDACVKIIFAFSVSATCLFKLSFLFPPCHQSALETLLTGYFLQGLTLCLLLLQNRIPDRNDAAAVQQFFMEEIQIGEDLIHQGLFSSFCFWVGGALPLLAIRGI